jgi:hypothetical protein
MSANNAQTFLAGGILAGGISVGQRRQNHKNKQYVTLLGAPIRKIT